MTWDLEADIDYLGNPIELVRALIDFFRVDLNGIRVCTTRGDWPSEDVSEIELNIEDDLITCVDEEIRKFKAADIAFQIQLFLDAGDPDYFPVPELYFFGEGLEGVNIRRRSPVVLGFGNRKGWMGKTILENSRRTVDEDLILSVLKRLCLEVRPKSLYLVNEEQVSIPFNEHFVYHSDISGFIVDLEDITRLILHGGDGYYTDARSRYQSLSSGQEPMLFCKRSELHRNRLGEYLVMRLPKLEELDHIKIGTDLIESALLESDDELDYFFDSNGLGIYSKPLFKGYVEAFYMEVIDDLTG